MRTFSRLGAVNAAIVSIYFAPVWGLEALKALTSPTAGFEDRAHAAVASFLRDLFGLGLDGLVRISNLLAGFKLVIAVGFLAYLIEFARALAVEREPNRETLNCVLMLALAAMAFWALPTLMLADAGVTRLFATQLLLLAGAAIVLTVDRHTESGAARSAPRTQRLARERLEARQLLAQGRLVEIANRQRPWVLQRWVR